jgi:heat shock protein HtpX
LRALTTKPVRGFSGDPEALASALVKLERSSNLVPAQKTPATASLFIVNPFGTVQSVSRWFSTPPQTQERVDRLLAMAREKRPQLGRSYSSRLVRGW